MSGVSGAANAPSQQQIQDAATQAGLGDVGVEVSAIMVSRDGMTQADQAAVLAAINEYEAANPNLPPGKQAKLDAFIALIQKVPIQPTNTSSTTGGASAQQSEMVSDLQSTFVGDTFNALLDATGLANQTDPPPTPQQLDALYQIAQQIADANNAPAQFASGTDEATQNLINQLVQDLSTSNSTDIASDLKALYEKNCASQDLPVDASLEQTFTNANGAGALIASANTAMVNFMGKIQSQVGPTLTPPTPLKDDQQTDLNGLLSSDPDQVLKALENMTGIPVANLTDSQKKSLKQLADQIAAANPPGLPGMDSENPQDIATAIAYALFGLEPPPTGGIETGIPGSSSAGSTSEADKANQAQIQEAIQTVAGAIANPGSVDSGALASAIATITGQANPDSSYADSLSMLQTLTGNVSSLNTAEVNFQTQMAINGAILANDLFLPVPPAGLNPYLQPSIMAILAPMLAQLLLIMNDIVTQSAKLDINMQKLKLSMAVAMFQFSIAAGAAEAQSLRDQADELLADALAEMITAGMQLVTTVAMQGGAAKAYQKGAMEAAEQADNAGKTAEEQTLEGAQAGRAARQTFMETWQQIPNIMSSIAKFGADMQKMELKMDEATQAQVKAFFNAVSQELQALMGNIDSTQSKADDAGKAAVQALEALFQLFKELAQAASQLKG